MRVRRRGSSRLRFRHQLLDRHELGLHRAGAPPPSGSGCSSGRGRGSPSRRTAPRARTASPRSARSAGLAGRRRSGSGPEASGFRRRGAGEASEQASWHRDLVGQPALRVDVALALGLLDLLDDLRALVELRLGGLEAGDLIDGPVLVLASTLPLPEAPALEDVTWITLAAGERLAELGERLVRLGLRA